MNNLFIVNNFFHLLTAFILSKAYFPSDNNYLVLIHPTGYNNWKNSPVLSYMSSINCGYKAVFPYINFLSHINKNKTYTKQVQLVNKEITSLNINNVFVGNDKDSKNQLFIATINFNKFYRFEDGLYSYYNKNISRKTSMALYHKIKLNLYKYLYNINGNISFNTTAIGNSQSAIADFLYKPNIIKRYSPKTIEIPKHSINAALNDIKQQQLLIPQIKNKSILYLSQPLVEQKIISINDELTCLNNILNLTNNNIEILYKPHPEDNPNKILFFKKHFPHLKIYNTNVPVELLYNIETNISFVISYRSTGLMYADIFGNHKIHPISLSNFSQHPINLVYEKIMKESGVSFPKSIQELSTYFTDL